MYKSFTLLFLMTAFACGKSNTDTPIEVESGVENSNIVNQLSDEQSSTLCTAVVRAIAPPVNKIGCLTLGYAGGTQTDICKRCISEYNETKTINKTCSKTTTTEENRKNCSAKVSEVEACTEALANTVLAVAKTTECGSRIVNSNAAGAVPACDALPAACRAYAEAGLFSTAE